MRGDLTAFLIGISLFIGLTAVGLALLFLFQEVWPNWMVYVLLYAPSVISGFVCGYLAQRHALTLVSLGVTCCVCLGIVNFTWGALGFPADLGGLAQIPWVIGLSLLTVAPLIVVGGAFGAKLQREPHA